MNREEIIILLEKLAGQQAPLDPLDWAPTNLIILDGPDSFLGYSQLNELLLLFGFDRITHAFFRFLLDGGTEYEPWQSFNSEESLKEGVDRFRRLAILLYGNVKFAFKYLSSDAELLFEQIKAVVPIDESEFISRHAPVLPIHNILPDEAYLTGYLTKIQLSERLDANPNDEEAKNLETQSQAAVRKAIENQYFYLASDHLDVYMATSMRERHEFRAIKKLTSEIFNDPAVAHLKLRWFDPT